MAAFINQAEESFVMMEDILRESKQNDQVNAIQFTTDFLVALGRAARPGQVARRLSRLKPEQFLVCRANLFELNFKRSLRDLTR